MHLPDDPIFAKPYLSLTGKKDNDDSLKNARVLDFDCPKMFACLYILDFEDGNDPQAESV